MRVFLAIIIGVIGGFILGIALSSFIAVIGLVIFDQPFGIKFLPYFSSLVCGFAVPIIDLKTHNK